ncbi:MAG: hypothetical protein NTV01_05875 [Bacteroidia bacterium]|nr:hypothetical protein [Bacteroidia bacterium]
MKKAFILIFCLGAAQISPAQKFIAEGRSALAVIPSRTTGVETAVASLNGTWEINMNPGKEVWKTGEGIWKKVQVPGEPAMQGYKVINDREFFYRTNITIPKTAWNKTILIRFNGVYSYARVFVNGNPVREHFGGFTAWDADISAFIEPGNQVVVHVGVTDRADDISYASGYAHHPIGGILREVQLLIVPKDYLNRFYIQTDLTADLKQASLSFNVAKSQSTAGGKVKFQLFDSAGKQVFNQPQIFDLQDNGSGKYSVRLSGPVLWNQEEPYLYSVKAELLSGGTTEEVIEQKIGFRKAEIDGKRLLVNGQPVKLRGACRHDVHPLLGRSTSRYYDSLDVVLAKEANINFIRTSHYPPSQDFLEFADRLGLYVEEETAICFVNDWREGIYNKFGQTYNDTAFTSRYLGQLGEMIDRDRNHPAVIIWSIGNESTYGINFQKEYDFVKSIDLSRPVSWSWPATALKENKRCFDIAIAHYPSYDGKDNENFGLAYKNMEHEKFPLLSDEWAHVPCYNLTLLRDDPNVKDFWGRSLDSMWSVRFDVPGNLGGAIWGMTDEIFHLPDTVTGYGPWGFIDVWRRKKTEFWNTKKAYSPVRILGTKWKMSGNKLMVEVRIKNRFNHIILNSIRFKVSKGEQSSFQPLPAIKPHEEGMIQVLVSETEKPVVLLQFYDSMNNLIDEELTSPMPAVPVMEEPKAVTWIVLKNGKQVDLRNNDLLISLDAVSGQLLKASVKGETILNGGQRVVINKPKDPGAFKESEGIYSGDFRASGSTIDTGNSECVIVKSSGFVSHYPVKMAVAYYPDGTIETSYEADSIPPYTWQIGLAYPVSGSIDEIAWERQGYWSTYPNHHLSANQGKTMRITNIIEHYRVKPEYDILQGMHDYYLTGAITAENAFMQGSEVYRATKENIENFDLLSAGKKRLSVESNGNQAAKMNIMPSGCQELLVLDKWDYWSIAWGNYGGSRNASTLVKGKVVVRIL